MVLNYLQWFIYHKTNPNQNKTFSPNDDKRDVLLINNKDFSDDIKIKFSSEKSVNTAFKRDKQTKAETFRLTCILPSNVRKKKSSYKYFWVIEGDWTQHSKMM